jgi:hypothetical protein
MLFNLALSCTCICGRCRSFVYTREGFYENIVVIHFIYVSSVEYTDQCEGSLCSEEINKLTSFVSNMF